MKVHVGCGKRNFGDDWHHVDGGDFFHLNSKDITLSDLKDESITIIYSSHLISYFDREEIIKLLLGWKRVLKPFGKLRLATPDMEAMMKLYNGGYSLEHFLGPVYGKMDMDNSKIYHKTGYDYKSLYKLLAFKIGMREIKKYDWRETDHAKFDDHSQAYIPKMDKENGTLISLNIECIK